MLIALILLVAVKVTAYGSANLWSNLLSISVYLFPTHLFLLPLESRDSLPTKLFFYLAAIVGNGVIYLLIFQLLFGVWIAMKRIMY